MAVYRVQDTSLTAVADAIRAKAGTSDALTFPDGFVEAVGGIQAGEGGAAGVSPKEVNFYDYDGTCVYAYSVAEAQALSELPAGPVHPGLVFQGWNWSLEGVKGLTRAMNIGAMYITDDGTTRLYITLQEGRTSPMLGICVNGTVTVDWGDGTEPDVLTGTNAASSPVWTPNHAYAAPGDYVIRLTINGAGGFAGEGGTTQGSYVLRHSASADERNNAYQASLKRVELGENTRSINAYAFYGCKRLTSITVPSSVTGIGNNAFYNCYSLASVTIPEGVTGIGSGAFYNCYSFASVAIPEGATGIGNNAFYNCYSFVSVTIPEGATGIGSSAFYKCNSLASVTIPEGVKSIGNNAFYICNSLAFLDFTTHTVIPTLTGTSAFSGIPTDCEIRVPAALYDEWVAATNWSTYADYIKAY